MCPAMTSVQSPVPTQAAAGGSWPAVMPQVQVISASKAALLGAFWPAGLVAGVTFFVLKKVTRRASVGKGEGSSGLAFDGAYAPEADRTPRGGGGR